MTFFIDYNFGIKTRMVFIEFSINLTNLIYSSYKNQEENEKFII